MVESIKILGLGIPLTWHSGEMIRLCETNAQQIMRLIKALANWHYSLKENDMIRLAPAFVISPIVYLIAYLWLQVPEKEMIGRIIRRVFKQPIEHPIKIPNEKLLALGIQNTLEELMEPQKMAQYEILTQSKTGRNILEELTINYTNEFRSKQDISYEMRKCMLTLPIPRNMYSEYHQ